MINREGPRTYHLKDIWNKYANVLLNKNPEWFGRVKNKIPNYYLYRKYRTDTKLEIIEVFSYCKFKEIVEAYFTLAKEEIIKGNVVNIKCVGVICATRFERDFKKKAIDFKKTKEQPLIWDAAKGKEVRAKIVYHTDDDYCRIKWLKGNALKNKTVYQFKPTAMNGAGNGTGFKEEFSLALTQDKTLKYKYPYFTL